MKNKNDTSVDGCIFSENRKTILLIKRRDVPVWVLPGGGIDSGETPEKAIIREIEEETGYITKIVRKTGEYTPINRLTRFTHLFDCAIYSGSPNSNEETKEIRFFPLDRLPPMPPPYLEWINDSTKNSPFLIKKKLSEVTYRKLFYFLITHPILVTRFLLSRIGLSINS